MTFNETFNAKINGKTISDFSKKLDYSLNQQDRIKLINELFYPDGNLELFFEEYFDKYYKVEINQEDPLSEDNVVCKFLDQISNYILYAPDAERITKKTKYNFYTEKELQKQLNKEVSIEGSVENCIDTNNNFDNNIYDEVLDFLTRKGKNQKKMYKQKIYVQDFYDSDFVTRVKIKNDNVIAVNVDNYLSQYQQTIFDFSNQLKLLKLKGSPVYMQRSVGNKIKDLRDDQVILKNQIKGTIYFKQVMPDSEHIDYQLFNFTNKTHVMALLRCNPKPLEHEIGMLTWDIENLLKECKLNDDEKRYLSLYRQQKQLGIKDARIVRMNVEKIANRVIKKYNEQYMDWVYLNYKKGKYKTCPKCNEIKLIQYFYKDTTKSNGFDSYCKNCRDLVGKNV